jgi:hypothetical protein
MRRYGPELHIAHRRVRMREKDMQEFDDLKKKVVEVEEELIKAEGGNKAAGTRVRKGMQEIKALAQAVRVKILEGRGEPTA